MNRLLDPVVACDECSGSGGVLIRPGLSRPCTCRYRVMEPA